MKDENDPKKSKKIINFIKEHPKISIATGGAGAGVGGGALFFKIGKISSTIKRNDLTVILEFFKRILSIVLENAFVLFLMIICICVAIYKYRELMQKWELRKKALEDFSPLLKEDGTIESIEMKAGEENIKLSVSRNSDKKGKAPPEEQTNEERRDISGFRRIK